MKFDANNYRGTISDKVQVGLIRENYQEGSRVRLLKMEGESIPSGTEGTVIKVDDIGQIHVAWDTGNRLALNLAVDSFHKC